MFKTILVPTDGWQLPDCALDAAVEFAKETGGAWSAFLWRNRIHFRRSQAILFPTNARPTKTSPATSIRSTCGRSPPRRRCRPGQPSP